MVFSRQPWKAMGSPCELHLHGQDLVAVARVAEAAIAEVARLERKYTRYRDDSLTSRINASAGCPRGVRVDDETASLLDYAETCFEQSGGLFDLTSGILRRAWDFHSGRLPSQAEIEPLLARVGWRRARWERPRFALPTPGMEIDFGGVVKEYAADRVAELCRMAGCHHALIDLGGDLAVVGPHPDGRPWRVGIRDPRNPSHAAAGVSVFAGGVASSGDYARCMVVDRTRYGHILDPRTGWPVRGLASVSVLSSHCLIAGSASTIAMLKGRDGVDWLEGLGLPHVRTDEEGRITRRLDRPDAGEEPRGTGKQCAGLRQKPQGRRLEIGIPSRAS
jgi:thiamine biosynthesis lipoprotein